MKKNIGALLRSVLLILLLVGCGRKAEDEMDKSLMSDIAGTIYNQAESISENIEAQTPVEESAAGIVENTSNAGTFEMAFIDGEVENNGGYFVRVGDRVYFRLYGQTSLDPVTVGTDVLSNGTASGGSKIMYYDINTQEVAEAFPDDGFGRIYVASDGFWLCRREDNGDEAPEIVLYRVSEDGSNIEDFGHGTPAGVSADGAYVAFLPYDEDYGSIEMLSGGEMLSMVSPEYGEDLTYIGIAEDQLVFLARTKEDYATSCHTLYSMDIVTTELTNLGKIPYEENSFVQDAYLIPEQFETRGKDVYVLAAQYEGSGHFLQDYIAVHAVAGKANSVDLIDYEEATSEHLPGIVITDDGAKLLQVKPYTASLSEGYYGSLNYYDSIHSVIQLVPDYVPDFAEDSLYVTALQTVEVVGDDVFVIRSLHERSPENDIGWRYAYRLDQMNYERFSWKILDENYNSDDFSSLGSVFIPQEGVNYIGYTDENASQSEESQSVTVYLKDDSTQLPSAYEYFDYAKANHYGMEIVFWPDSAVQEFWLYELSWNNNNEEYKEIYHKRELTPDMPLVANVTFPGDMSAYAFSYYLDDGSEKLFRITISGMDGSLLVTEIEN